MLPQQSGDSPENQAESSLEGKLDCMGLDGYGTTARENVELNRYLNTPGCLWLQRLTLWCLTA